MPDLDQIKFVIETLPGARAQVSIDMPAPHPGMRIGTPAHALAIDALGWLGKQPAVAGFVYSPSSPSTTYLAEVQQHKSTCRDIACPGCIPVQAAHIVLDLETLSTQPNAVVASIGAVALTAHGNFVSEFHVAVDTGAPQHLRHVCPNTVAWWEQQSEAAKLGSVSASNPMLPHQALEAFTAWVQRHADSKKVKAWGNGSSFDNVILSSLYADYPELVRPWAYWNDRDMRTVLDLYPQAKDVGEFEGVKHDALYDARHEAKQLAAALRLAAASHAVYSPVLASYSDDQQILLAASGLLQSSGYPAAAAAVLRAMDAPGLKLTAAAHDVLMERARQVAQEGYDTEHDDSHVNDEIAAMAALFVMPEAARDWDASSTGYGRTLGEAILPPDWNYPRLGDRRDQLVKGAAMAMAEIERIDRTAQASKGAAA